MILPKNGSVVIIDDRPEEVLPIIEVLSKRGISTTYYKNNNPLLLPDKPSQIIRLLFLDLQLIETTNEDQIAKIIIELLQKLISPENGPYIMVIWSKNRAKYESTLDVELSKHPHLVPSGKIGFDKRDCLNEAIIPSIESEGFIKKFLGKVEGRFNKDDIATLTESIQSCLKDEFRTEFVAKDNAFEIIESRIKNELEKAGVFHLFVIWENLIVKAGSKTVNTISGTIEKSDLWEINMRDIIKRLAIAQTGQNSITNDVALCASMTTFSHSFSEDLEYEIRDYKFPEYIKLETPYNIASKSNGDIIQISIFQDADKLKAKLLKNGTVFKGKEGVGISNIKSLSEGIPEPDKAAIDKLVNTYIETPNLINTKLHVELNPIKELIPGNVYKMDVDADKKKFYLHTYFDKLPEDLSDYNLVELEVSPMCDYAQSKWKKSRLISGIVYPESTTFKAKSQGDHFYRVQPSIIIDKRVYKLIFDFQLFKSLDKETVEKRTLWFRIKRELLQDIISGLSGHVNRPGITAMI